MDVEKSEHALSKDRILPAFQLIGSGPLPIKMKNIENTNFYNISTDYIS
jgi:hypothetical protein